MHRRCRIPRARSGVITTAATGSGGAPAPAVRPLVRRRYARLVRRRYARRRRWYAAGTPRDARGASVRALARRPRAAIPRLVLARDVLLPAPMKPRRRPRPTLFHLALPGALLTGVFASEAMGGAPGLFDGNGGQVLTQIYGIASTLAWSAIATTVILKVIDMAIGLRVDKETEVEGLDIRLHGEVVQ